MYSSYSKLHIWYSPKHIIYKKVDFNMYSNFNNVQVVSQLIGKILIIYSLLHRSPLKI